MQMHGERRIDASREDVWRALNDPEVLKACIPGCEELTQTSDTSLAAKVTQKVGPVKARFAGAVELTDIVVTESYTLSGEAKGGPAGFAKGEARVALADADGGTLLTYDVDAKVGGKLAQLGNRLIDGFARKMAEEFFARFQAAVEGPPDEAEAGQKDTAAGSPAGPRKSWLARLIAWLRRLFFG
jgi:carbon monoxide dehydrogenase subunit G